MTDINQYPINEEILDRLGIEPPKGENEQEVAEPAQDNSNDENLETGVIEEAAEPHQEERQSDEDNSKYAAARRKAEQERDEAIRIAREEAQKSADNLIAEMGLVNPHTQRVITTKAEYDEYKVTEAQRQKNELIENQGISEEEFNSILRNTPEYQEAIRIKEMAAQELRKIQEMNTQSMIAEDIKAISQLSGKTYETLEDLSKDEKYSEMVEINSKYGLRLPDAYKLVYLDDLTNRNSEAIKQKAKNDIASKKHLHGFNSGGVTNDVIVSNSQKEKFRRLMPNLTDKEIQEYMNKTQKG